jgi:hypothetical protein
MKSHFNPALGAWRVGTTFFIGACSCVDSLAGMWTSTISGSYSCLSGLNVPRLRPAMPWFVSQRYWSSETDPLKAVTDCPVSCMVMLWPDATGVREPCEDVAACPAKLIDVAGATEPLADVTACPVRASVFDGESVPWALVVDWPVRATVLFPETPTVPWDTVKKVPVKATDMFPDGERVPCALVTA